MKKIFSLNLTFIKYICPALLVAALSGAASGATFTVTRADDRDSVCNSGVDCSLREAVNAAKVTPDDDVIEFAPDLTLITLTTEIKLHALFNGSVRINGRGANVFTINGGAGTNRIFSLLGTTATFSGMTLTGGNGRGENRDGFGGAIHADSAFVTLERVYVTGNTTSSAGGGISFNNGNHRIIDSTFSSNTAFDCGGVSTGGFNEFVMSISNTTISGNTVNQQGGGLCAGGNTTLRNVTITNNTANSSAGGILKSASGTLTMGNTIVSGNSAANGTHELLINAGAVTSVGNNLVGDSPGDSTTTGSTLIVYQPSDIRDTPHLLSLLQNNGGPTPTHALLFGSPAIDNGNNSLAVDPSNGSALTTDQRGFNRLRDGDGNGTAQVDIGAYELRAAFVLNVNDGGAGSLRQAIADMVTQVDAVIFSGSLFSTPQTLTLTGGELQIDNTNGPFYISGPGASLLTISGNNQGRVFNIGANANVTLSGLRISGGNSPGNGGSIYNSGRLAVTNSTVTGNSAASFGGGIFNNDGAVLNFSNSASMNNSAATGGGIFNSMNGSLAVNGSTVSGNSASSGFGGGITNNAGTMTLSNSTISGNNGGGIFNGGTGSLNNSTISGNTATYGGGIFSNVLLNLTHTTIANNTATTYGGGIYTNAGTVNAFNSIIADNISDTGIAPDFSGNLVSQGNNLIENTNGTTITGTTTGNILGRDPLLLPLNNYGGLTQTHALRYNSPATDKAGGFASGIDQRGRFRTYNFIGIPNPAGGADIGAFERHPNDTSGLLFDFDGDNRADLSVFRPSTGVWYLQQSTAGFTGVTFGLNGDQIAPADFDGDGRTDLAVFRPSTGIWYLQRSTAGLTAVAFGANGDVPVSADFTGDGKAEIAVFRPSNGTWYLYNLVTNQDANFVFGLNGDIPVAGDYDGDGKADLAVFRPSSGIWYLNRSTAGFQAFTFGLSGDTPVPADYDGDLRTDVAVFRPSNGAWYIQRSTSGFTGITFGLGTDLPVPADYDGDGRIDVAVFRDGAWYLQRSTAGFTGVSFGLAGDTPVPHAFIR